MLKFYLTSSGGSLDSNNRRFDEYIRILGKTETMLNKNFNKKVVEGRAILYMYECVYTYTYI